MAPPDTGFSVVDSQEDFTRARRRRILSRLSATLRRDADDVEVMLPFDEVVAALGRRGEADRGLQSIPLHAIVGTVDRGKEFDRNFRPTSARVRPRFERIAKAQRRGESMPPIDVYKVGELYFVRDGHHRVAVAREHGRDLIDARVVEVLTEVALDPSVRVGDLPVKGHERLFYERVPLARDARTRLSLTDPWQFGVLAEAVEAWGFRDMQGSGRLLNRAQVAHRWFDEEYVPVVDMLGEAGLIHAGESETDAYLRLSADRYRLMRTHEWTEETLERLRASDS
jgi:hypothetical protein